MNKTRKVENIIIKNNSSFINIELSKLYTVPKSKDPEDGCFWYSLLDNSSFTSSNIGWISGATQVLRTVDGGKTWDNFYSNKDIAPFSHTNYLFALDENICWFISVDSILGSRSCVTKDGGKTWIIYSFGLEVFLHTAFFLNSEVGWLMGNTIGGLKKKNYVQYKTKNSGKDWQLSETNISITPRKAIFLDSERGWLLGSKILSNKNQTQSQLLFTIDGGKTWDVLRAFDTEMFDFQLINGKTFVVVGENGWISLSEDNGKNWMSIKSKIRTNLNAVHFRDKNFGIAVGDFGRVFIIENSNVNVIRIRKSENFVGINVSDNNDGYLTSNKAIYRFTLT